MRLNRRLALVGALSAFALAVGPGVAQAGDGGDDGADLVDSVVIASTPGDTPTVVGTKAGGLPWVIDRGEVRVRASGRMDVRLEGLQILRADGTEDNPVPAITASLYCGGVLPAVAASPLEPLSVPGGDAQFRVWLDVPESCDMATVLINPNGALTTFIGTAMGTDDD